VLDEKSLRRPGFKEDIPIELADGQQWHVPRPVVEFGMVWGDDGRPTFRRSSLGFGSDHMALLDEFYAASLAEQYNIMAQMACNLLRINYDLDQAALTSLLPYRPSDPANVRMWEALAGVATGNPDPKDEPEDDM
jgi:hypothetical protein